MRWDRAAFPYLVTACWDAGGPPLVVVQSRDQRRMHILAVDPAAGSTTVIRADTGDPWLEIVPGVPARTAAGAIVWTADDADTRRLLVAGPQQLADSTAAPVTPAGLQVREILSVDGDTVLFAASDGEPTQIGLWSWGPDGLRQPAPGGTRGCKAARRAGGTTVLAARSLRRDGAEFTVLRDSASRDSASRDDASRGGADRPGPP